VVFCFADCFLRLSYRHSNRAPARAAFSAAHHLFETSGIFSRGIFRPPIQVTAFLIHGANDALISSLELFPPAAPVDVMHKCVVCWCQKFRFSGFPPFQQQLANAQMNEANRTLVKESMLKRVDRLWDAFGIRKFGNPEFVGASSLAL